MASFLVAVEDTSFAAVGTLVAVASFLAAVEGTAFVTVGTFAAVASFVVVTFIVGGT